MRQAIQHTQFNGRQVVSAEAKATVLIDRTYGWQRPYEAAILETDRVRLPKLIAEAQAAIDARMKALNSPSGREQANGVFEERQAIEDALAGIRILIREVSEPNRQLT
jgi:hypothetical protein